MDETFKLKKLQIEAYDTSERKDKKDTFEAMFNPQQIKRKYGLAWADHQGANGNGTTLKYQHQLAEEFTINLILDGTNVDNLATIAETVGVKNVAGAIVAMQAAAIKKAQDAAKRATVKDRVQKLLDVAYAYQGDTHEPRYLRVVWGSFQFNCRLRNIDVTYSLLDRDGTPLRADLAITFVSDEDVARLAKLANKQSPDLTHARIVHGGDTLPLLTRSIYGSSERYLDVARYNGLTDFRVLQPGQQILFPPLAVLNQRAAGRG